MKRVVIATDGSQVSLDAACLLAHLPHNSKLDITVVSVIQGEQSYHRHASDEWVRGFVAKKTAEAEESFETILKMFEGSNATLRHEIRDGHVGQAIVRIAEELDSDLIVIGATGHSELSRILLGSTSDYVATHAHCSVLLVRPTGLIGANRAIRVAVAFDSTQPSRKCLTEFSEVPWGIGTDVMMVTALARFFGIMGEIAPSADAVANAESQVLQASQSVAKVAPKASAHVVQDENFGEGLVRFAEKHKCDIMFIGETKRTALGRSLVGSVSRYILRHAPCSVWVTRQSVAEADTSPHNNDSETTASSR
ncbi:universal stress protein [Stieleria varia]|uniref:Universal stress protein G n=1 Tax=Stieleria varia TaxID=2528005 RepID=A0A5C5ZKV0_9BACT|nr:universal stress protein [Stieleria varia]TWT87785.1 Universal stress protein G [Stieleria varia]